MKPSLKGTLGKLIVQDWNIVTGWSDTPLLFILTRQQAAALISLSETLAWRTRWTNAPDQDTIDAFASETMFNLMNPITCAMLTQCLQPLFDNVSGQITSLQDLVEQIQGQVAESTTVQPPQPQTVEGCNLAKAYSGCVAVVEAVNVEIIDVYEVSEAEAPDNLQEWSAILLEAIPGLAEFPLDELAEFLQWTFDNQRATYEAAYTATWRDGAACKLFCYVQDDCELSHEDITAWLTNLETEFPGNAAAQVFTRFGKGNGSALADTLGETINTLRGGETTAEFFNRLLVQYGVGAQTENNGYLACDVCEWCRTYDLTVSPSGWTIYANGGIGNQAQQSIGDGYEPAAANPSRVTIWKDFGTAIHITSVLVERTADFVGGDTNLQSLHTLDGSNVFVEPGFDDAPIVTEHEFVIDQTISKLGLDTVGDGDPDGSLIPGYLFKITLSGIGAPPEDGDDCP